MENDDEDDQLLDAMEQLENSFNDSRTSSSPKCDSSYTESINSQFPLSQFEPPSTEHLNCLKDNFGHTTFRPMQWEIIHSIINDKSDSCVVMTTGYGKSLCFQYPSVYTNGITFVVSPLISLMEDQVMALTIANIPACLLGTAQTNQNIEDDIIDGIYRVVYLSPEKVSTSLWLFEQLRDKLTLVAIDEAHCVSKWGHDFRKNYRHLDEIRKIIPNVPILAVTATATERVRKDICESLCLRNPRILCTGFNRSNLEFFVRKKTNIWNDLRPFVTSKKEGSFIIYCMTRKLTETVCSELKKYNVKCEQYHAGMLLKERKKILEDFLHDKLNIIIATIAFGMGIDKPDVRYVIHYGASRDMESYYQEVGRAGRDGLPAKCIMFFASGDFTIYTFLDEKISHSQTYLKYKEELRHHMKDYCYTSQCRRQFILQYFDGPDVILKPQPNCCDNCRNKSSITVSDYEGIDENGLYDFTNDARYYCEALALFNGYSGLKKPIDVLRGIKNNKTERYSNHRLFGIGQFKSTEYWNCLINQLECSKFFIKNNSATLKFGHLFKLSVIGEIWMNSGAALKLKPIESMYKFIRNKKRIESLYDVSIPSTSTSTALPKTFEMPIKRPNTQENLRKSLLAFRTELASKYDCMPYMIASNKAIDEMAKNQPLNLNEIRCSQIDGMSEAKIIKFGLDFIECIMKSKNLLAVASTLVENEHTVEVANEMEDRNKIVENVNTNEFKCVEDQYLDEDIDQAKSLCNLELIQSNCLQWSDCDDSFLEKIAEKHEQIELTNKNEVPLDSQNEMDNEAENDLLRDVQTQKIRNEIRSSGNENINSISNADEDRELIDLNIANHSNKTETKCIPKNSQRKSSTKLFSSKRIRYENSSDSDEDKGHNTDKLSNENQSPKRALPLWLLETSQPQHRVQPTRYLSGIKKRNIF